MGVLFGVLPALTVWPSEPWCSPSERVEGDWMVLLCGVLQSKPMILGEAGMLARVEMEGEELCWLWAGTRTNSGRGCTGVVPVPLCR